MEEKTFRTKAINAIVKHFNKQVEKTDNITINAKDVYVVWECKTLQNNKALLSTTVPDGMYYEFTWNGDKNEGYLDSYKKWSNEVIK